MEDVVGGVPGGMKCGDDLASWQRLSGLPRRRRRGAGRRNAQANFFQLAPGLRIIRWVFSCQTAHSCSIAFR